MAVAMLACGMIRPSIIYSAPVSTEATLYEVIFRDGFEPPLLVPANDTCATATELVIGSALSGTTIGAKNDYNSGLELCTGFAQPGADVVYKVPLGMQSYTVTLSDLSAMFDASISIVGVGPQCEPQPVTCRKGKDAGDFGASESFQYTPYTAGYYYIIVDSAYGGQFDGGAFTITVTTP